MTGAIQLLAILAVVVVAVALVVLVVILHRSRRSTWSTDVTTTERLEQSLGAAMPRTAVSDPGREPEPTKAEARAAGTESAAEYRLLAPIELRFTGESSVVGVRADTETAAAFQRAADELTDGMMDYHESTRARSSSGAEPVRGVERGAGI